MKSAIFFALCLAAFGASGVTQQAPQVAVEASTPSAVVKLGAEIRINVTVTNLSEKTIALTKACGPDGQAEAANDVQVYDSMGKRVSWTATHPAVWTCRKSFRVAPGDSEHDYLILNELFNLSTPGKYLVTVRQELPVWDSDSGKDTIYVSAKPLIITVAE